ncbi:MAG: GIY-YIG nuclease family protein [Candidatus Saccharimonadales bacterium]
MYYTCILKSQNTRGAIYIGSTANLRIRLYEHNAGLSIYTNKHVTWTIESYFAFTDAQTAEEFERCLKSNSGKAFLLKRLVSKATSQNRILYKNGRSNKLHYKK